MSGITQDLRYALRDLLKNPGFTLIAVLTLAIGIGANTAMFSVIRGVLLDPLPYPDPDRLYRIFYNSEQFPRFPVNPTDFMDFREQQRSFESLAVFTQSDRSLSDPTRPERLATLQVSKDYFHVLGTTPQMGRDFEANDEARGSGKVVMLSDALWKRRFDADRAIVGRKVLLDGEPYTVIGVMRPEFQHVGGTFRSPAHGATVDVWIPFTFLRGGRGGHFLNAVARLAPGVDEKRATDDLNRMMADLAKDFPGTNAGWRLSLVSLREEIVGRSQKMLLVLLGAVGFVLLIACVNVAGLLLVRATARGRDLAVQAALGASRRRLIRQCLVEAGMLSLLGAAAGALIATWGVKVLASLISGTVPRADLIRIDPLLFGFTIALALATGLIFGLIPAFTTSRGDLSRTLRDGGRSATAGTGSARVRSALVVGEIALASALLIGAGLFLRSFVNLVRLDPGFQPDRVITATVALPRARFAKGEDRARFFQEYLERVSRLPGIRSAGASSDLPWTGYDENAGFIIEGRAPDKKNDPHARYHAATPGFFRAMGIPLMSGRFFEESDDPKAPRVILINASMARAYWPGEDAVGKRITFSSNPKPEDFMSVVGVVGDVKDSPSANAAEPAFWWPHRQQPFGEMMMAVRTEGDPAAMVGAIRSELAQMDREIPLANVRTMEQIAGTSRNGPRLVLLLTGVFSALALVLAAVGTYGVISYSVAQRMHEFGVRIALGAQRSDLFRLVGQQGLRLAAAGIVIGLLLALALGRLLGSLLYGVGAADPLALGVSFVVALIVALAACFVPARRAATVDPMVSLRSE